MDDFIWEKLERHRRITSDELTVKGKFSKGYYETLQVLTQKKDVREKKELVNHIFVVKKTTKDNPVNRGSLSAISDLKKHNLKKGKNIYGEPLKKRKIL